MSAENKLNKLFEQARSAEPDMPLESIEKLVELKANKSSYFKKINPFKTLFIMSVFLIIFTSFFLFFNKQISETKMEGKPIVNKHNQEKLPNTILPETIEEKLSPLKKLELNNIQTKHPINFSEANSIPIAEPSIKVQKQIERNFIQLDTPFSYRAINIAAIKVIELTNEELKNLGISVSDKKIKIPIGEGRSSKSVLDKSGATFEFKIDFKQSGLDSILNNAEVEERPEMPVSNAPATFGKDFYSSASMTLIDLGDTSNKVEDGKPIPHYSLITDDLGQKWRVYEVDDGLTAEDNKYMRDNNLSPLKWEKAVKGRQEGERKLIEKIPSFVPVLVRSGDTNLVADESFYRADIIIWFEPSEELFSALPERISAELRKEYQSVFGNKTTTSQSCKYFEACQNAPGAIQGFSLFPNPTDGELNAEFNLSEARTIEANVYSINGILQRKILSAKSFEMGKHKLQTNLSDLLPGVYLLVIESDKGDVISRRIVRR